MPLPVPSFYVAGLGGALLLSGRAPRAGSFLCGPFQLPRTAVSTTLGGQGTGWGLQEQTDLAADSSFWDSISLGCVGGDLFCLHVGHWGQQTGTLHLGRELGCLAAYPYRRKLEGGWCPCLCFPCSGVFSDGRDTYLIEPYGQAEHRQVRAAGLEFHHLPGMACFPSAPVSRGR